MWSRGCTSITLMLRSRKYDEFCNISITTIGIFWYFHHVKIFNANPYICGFGTQPDHLLMNFIFLVIPLFQNDHSFQQRSCLIFPISEKINFWTYFPDNLRHHFFWSSCQVMVSNKVSQVMDSVRIQYSIYFWVHCNRNCILSYFIEITLFKLTN